MKKSKMYEIGIEIFLEEEAHWESMRRAVCSGALAPPEWMDSEMMELFSEGQTKN